MYKTWAHCGAISPVKHVLLPAPSFPPFFGITGPKKDDCRDIWRFFFAYFFYPRKRPPSHQHTWAVNHQTHHLRVA